MATAHEYDIICLWKTFLDSSFNLLDDPINIEGYNLLIADHPNDNIGGGGCMQFKEHLPNLRRDDPCNLPECLVTETRMSKKN